MEYGGVKLLLREADRKPETILQHINSPYQGSSTPVIVGLDWNILPEIDRGPKMYSQQIKSPRVSAIFDLESWIDLALSPNADGNFGTYTRGFEDTRGSKKGGN